MGRRDAKPDKGVTRSPFDRKIQGFFDTTIVPPEVIKRVTKIAKVLDPLEPAAHQIWGQPKHRALSEEFLQTLFVAGVFSDDLVEQVVCASKQFTRFFRQGLEGAFQQAWSRADEYARIGIGRDPGQVVRAFFHRMESSNIRVLEKINRDQRPLLSLFFDEMAFHTHVVNLEYAVAHTQGKFRGQVLDEMQPELTKGFEEGRLSPPVYNSFYWMKFAHDVHAQLAEQRLPSTTARRENVLVWLENVTLVPEEPGNESRFPLPGLFVHGLPVFVRLHIPDDLHPLSIAGFSLETEKFIITNGEVSRLNHGHLTANGSFVVSMQEKFQVEDKVEVYEYIRQVILDAVVAQYERTQLHSDEDREAFRLLLSEDHTPKPVASPGMELSAPQAPQVQEIVVVPDLVPAQPTVAALAKWGGRLEGEYDPTRARRRRRQKLPEQMPGLELKAIITKMPGMSWDFKKGDHPHIVSARTGNRLRFDNVHSGNTRVVYRKEIVERLGLLGISEEEFLEKM